MMNCKQKMKIHEQLAGKVRNKDEDTCSEN